MAKAKAKSKSSKVAEKVEAVKKKSPPKPEQPTKDIWMALEEPYNQIFEKAIENASPSVEVKSRRIGGATYQVPVEVAKSRRMAMAMRWIIQYSKSRKGQTMADRLAAEFIAASNNEGSSIKKKEDTHKMAEANKAFAHFG